MSRLQGDDTGLELRELVDARHAPSVDVRRAGEDRRVGFDAGQTK